MAPSGASSLLSRDRLVKEAWKNPFIGDSDKILLRKLQSMYEKTIRAGVQGCSYMHHTSIVQSSGSGKSRMVDAVSRLIFTIPCNLRSDHETKYGAWPHPDGRIRDFLVGYSHMMDEDQLSLKYLCFFQALFESTTKELNRCFGKRLCVDATDCASRWYDYLEEGNNRAVLYDVVIKRAVYLLDLCVMNSLGNQEAYKQAEREAENDETDLRTVTAEGSFSVDEMAKIPHQTLANARVALRDLVSTVCTLSQCPSDHLNTRVVESLHVHIYFDEAHVLAASNKSSTIEAKSPLDVLIKTLNWFRHLGAMTVLLSTQIESLVPSASLARSARYRLLVSKMHAPITETPFDCFGEYRLVPRLLKADDVGTVEFMACFGRPLWASMLSSQPRFAVLQKYGRLKPSSAHPVSYPSYARPVSLFADDDKMELIELASAKLLRSNELHLRHSDYSAEAQVAVLDVRIMLSYDVGYARAQRHLMELVASHMRTVYSIPDGQESLRSGYSSEPILAEGAARQLARWRRSERRPLDDFAYAYEAVTADAKRYPAYEPALTILRQNNGLLDREEIGEAVGRLLLTLAHDHAVINTGEPLFSRPVSVEAFIRALFRADNAERILNMHPDNQRRGDDSKTFREVYKNAVLNFTHFAKWEDDSLLTEDAVLGSFMRNMAAICRNAVDTCIPIVLDRRAPLGPENMSVIFVQFKIRGKRGSLSAYAIDEEEIKFFARNRAEKELRPYITLIMELGVTTCPPPLARTPTKSNPKSSEGAQPLGGSASASKGPVTEGVLRSSAVRTNPRTINEHPRYGVYVYGCSSSVYNVIEEHERTRYQAIIRQGDLLDEHPSQDAESLALVRNQKPFFASGNATWHWIKNEVLDDQCVIGDGGDDSNGEVLLQVTKGSGEDEDDEDDEAEAEAVV